MTKVHLAVDRKALLELATTQEERDLILELLVGGLRTSMNGGIGVGEVPSSVYTALSRKWSRLGFSVKDTSGDHRGFWELVTTEERPTIRNRGLEPPAQRNNVTTGTMTWTNAVAADYRYNVPSVSVDNVRVQIGMNEIALATERADNAFNQLVSAFEAARSEGRIIV